MQHAHVYLNFPGTADAALTFYASVFGRPVQMRQTFGEAPFMGPLPPHARDLVLHAQLPLTDTVHLMASDHVEGLSPSTMVRGNDLHISLVADDRAEADRVFGLLSSDGGQVRMPLGNAPWGPYFGMCVDRFGVQWMISLPNAV